jgi:3-deoxy-7-phosphoheptulonate synthase
MSLASIMAGADGIMVEVHDTPEKAYSDGQQTLDYSEASTLYERAGKTYELRKNL